jgi:hypothetical protein
MISFDMISPPTTTTIPPQIGTKAFFELQVKVLEPSHMKRAWSSGHPDISMHMRAEKNPSKVWDRLSYIPCILMLNSKTRDPMKSLHSKT